MATTVRASEHAHRVLRQYSDREGISLTEALDRLTADWERRAFFQSLNDSFAELRANSEAWEEELEERRLWDRTLMDNLDDGEQNDADTEPG